MGRHARAGRFHCRRAGQRQHPHHRGATYGKRNLNRRHLGVYPLGQLAFEIIAPNDGVWTESQMDAIDLRGNSIRVLRTHRFNDGDGTSQTTHDFLGLDVASAQAGAYWSGGLGQERARLDLDRPRRGQTPQVRQRRRARQVLSLPTSRQDRTTSTKVTLERRLKKIRRRACRGTRWKRLGSRQHTWCTRRLMERVHPQVGFIGPFGRLVQRAFGFGVTTDPNLLSWATVYACRVEGKLGVVTPILL